MALFIAV